MVPVNQVMGVSFPLVLAAVVEFFLPIMASCFGDVNANHGMAVDHRRMRRGQAL